MGFFHRHSYFRNCVSGAAMVVAGASTNAILNSLQTETDGFIINWAQGNSGVIKAVDSTVPTELFTTPDFSSATGWTTGSWVISGGQATATLVNSSFSLREDVGLTPGRMYEFVIDIDSFTAGSFKIKINGGTATESDSISTAGTHTIRLTAQAAADGFVALNCSGTSAVINSWTCQQVNQALTIQELTQSLLDVLDYTSPFIKNVWGPNGKMRYAAHNLLPWALDFSNANWTNSRTTETGGQADPFGGTEAYKLAEDTSTGGHYIVDGITPGTGTFRFGVHVKADEREHVGLYFGGPNKGYGINLSTGAFVDMFGGDADDYGATDLGDGWYYFWVEAQAATVTNVQIYLHNGTTTSYLGDGSSGIFIYGAHLHWAPADTTFLATTGSARYAIPQTHDPVIYDTSTSAVTIGTGVKTFTTAGSDIFTPRQNIKIWKDDDNWMSGTVVVQSGTTLMVSIDHTKGSGSHSSWHLSKIVGRVCEPAATNEFTYSNNTANAAWTKAAISVSEAVGTAPNGETVAEKIVEDGSSAVHQISAPATISWSGSETVAKWVKDDGDGRYFCIRMFVSSQSYLTVVYDPATGIATKQQQGTNNAFSDIEVGFEAGPDGWFRVWVTASTTNTVFVRWVLSDTATPTIGSTGTVSYAGDGSSGVLTWNGQCETGTRPTSDVITVGSTITRLKDDTTKDASELPIGTSAHSFVASATKDDVSDNGYLLQLYETANDRIALHVNSSATARLLVIDTSTQAAIGNTVYSDNEFKLAASAVENDFAACVNGGAISTDGSGTLGITPSVVYFGQRDGASDTWGGVLEYTKYLPRQVSDADLQTETARDNYAGSKGASTLALANSLREEPEVAVWNWKQMVYHIKDQSTPANNANTQPITDLVVDYTSPFRKHVTGPDRLLKYAAHNLILHSGDFSNAAWTVINGGTVSAISKTPNYATDPDGGSTACRLQVTAGAASAGSDYGLMRQAASGTSVDDNCETEVWLKSNTGADQQVCVVYNEVEDGVVTVTSDWQKFTVGNNTGVIRYDLGVRGNTTANDDLDILMWHPIVRYAPGQSVYLETTTAARYAIPVDHDAATYTTSTTAIAAAYGAATITTADSATFTAGEHIRISDQSAPYTNYLTGTVTSHVSDQLTINVDHYYGTLSGVSSWHCIKIDGALSEPAATNEIRDSRDITEATWGTTASAVNSIDASAVGPNGETGVGVLADSGSGGAATVWTDQTRTVATSTQYTFSAICKEKQLSWVSLGLVDFTTPVNTFAYFDLANGVEGTQDAGWDDTGMEPLGNGYYLVWGAFTTDAADTSGKVRLYLADGDGDRTVDRDGTSDLYIWDAQLETGSVPTSRIHTPSSSTVTRLADDLRKDGTEFVINRDDKQTVVVQTKLRDLSSQYYLHQIWEAGSDRAVAYVTGATHRIFTREGGVTQGSTVGDAAVAGTEHLSAYKFAEDDFAVSVDGGTPDVDTTGTNGMDPIEVHFGHHDGANVLNGHLGFTKHTPRGVPNADLQLETAA